MKASLFAILLFLAGLAAGRSRKDVDRQLNLVARASGAKLLSSSSSSSNEPKKCEPFAVTCGDDCQSYSVCVSKDNSMKTECPKDPADNTKFIKFCNPQSPYEGCSAEKNPCKSKIDDKFVCTLNNEFFPLFGDDFTKFYYCVDSKAMVYECPLLEVVNITSMACMAKPEGFQAPVSPCKGTSGMVVVKENPSYFAFCSGAAIQYLFKCPSGQTFSELSRTCKTPCKNGEKWADPKDCNQYIQCDWGTEVAKKCFVGGFFSPTTKSCGITKPPNCA